MAKTYPNYSATAEGPRASDVGHVHDLSILQAGPLSAFRADYIHTFPFWGFLQYHQWGIPLKWMVCNGKPYRNRWQNKLPPLVKTLVFCLKSVV